MDQHILIEIADGRETESGGEAGHLIITAEEFYRFVCVSLLAEVKKNAAVICERCGSFEIPTDVLYRLFESADEYPDEALYNDNNENFDLAAEIIGAVQNSLTAEITATDDEWAGYLAKGKPDLRPLHDKDGDIVCSLWSGNPLRLKHEAAVFKFSANCESCDKLFQLTG